MHLQDCRDRRNGDHLAGLMGEKEGFILARVQGWVGWSALTEV